MTGKDHHMETFFNRHRDVIVCLCLIIATLAVYWQVRTHEFIDFDDEQYVTENPNVQAGLTSESIAWAFRSMHASNWHPVTWLFHMLEYQLYGTRASWHHMTSVLLHIASTLLLFLVLKRMTGKLWRSAFVAALFALHPLHVESVAWASERKDVLSTFFWMLTMYGYIWYARRPCTKRYLPVLAAFALGLMAKPMLVTLPFVLLLIDYWPLGRLDAREERRAGIGAYWSLVREKLPLFVLSAVSCVVTFLVQKHGGAVRTLEHMPLDSRIANALVSYVHYVVKMIWPAHLAVYYPYPLEGIPVWRVAGAALLLACITVIVFRQRRRHPYMIVGWLWYLGTLVPVIGLVQVGSHAIADRYTYMPLVGLFIIVAWGVPELVARWRYRTMWLGPLAAATLSILMATTWLQVRYWTSSITLFEHALDITANNYVAYNNLGVALYEQGKVDDAISHYSEALRISPGCTKAHYNLGLALAEQGNLDDAISHYLEALHMEPDHVNAHNNLGLALYRQDKFDDAINHYSEALRIKPHSARLHNNLGIVLAAQGKIDDAIHHYSEALRMEPDHVKAHNNLVMAHNSVGIVLLSSGKIEEALVHFHEALRLEPNNATLHHNLGNIYRTKGDLDEARAHYQNALSIQPEYTDALNNLALVYAAKGEFDKALSSYMKLIRLRPDSYVPYYNIACVYSQQNMIEESIDWLKKAIEKGFNDWDLLKTDQSLENIRGSVLYKELALP